MADPTWPVFPAFAFLGFFLPLVPLTWHFQAWNSGTCYYMLWAALGSLNVFINSIVWHNTAMNLAPVWCDISIRITIGASVGIPAASLCINRRLYNIAKVQMVTISRAEKRRLILVDTFLCVGLPLVCMALAYIVQGHRFNIFEDVGCYPAIYDSLPVFFLVSMWPILLGIISGTYCVLSLRAFLKRQATFSDFLASNETITVSRYFRLMALSMTEIMCTIPLAIFTIVLNVQEGVNKWVSWDDTHFDYNRVELFPAVIWRIRHVTVVSVEFSRWSVPVCGIIFFLFFGFADEAKRNYKLALWTLAKLFGFKPASNSSSTSHGHTHVKGINGLPVYRPPPPNQRKRADSFASSFTDTIAAPAYTPPTTSQGVKQLTIDTKKRAHVPPASFSPTADELVMITHMLRISDSTDALHPPEPAMLRGSITYSDYTLEAVTIHTPTTFTYDISTPTTPTLVVDTPSTSTYTVPSPSSSMHPTFHPSPPASPTWPRDNYSTAV